MAGLATGVAILSMHATEEYVLQALCAGAAAYLLKRSAVAELEVAIRAVTRGETYLSPAVSKHVVDEYVRWTVSEADPLAALSPWQREILQLVAEGQTSREIGQRLGVCHRTVEVHRNQLMKRLGIRDLPGLVRFAVRVGPWSGKAEQIRAPAMNYRPRSLSPPDRPCQMNSIEERIPNDVPYDRLHPSDESLR